jgi:hypothetical protein
VRIAELKRLEAGDADFTQCPLGFRLFLILLSPSAIFIKNPALRAELLLKNSIFLGIAAIICLSLQICISYVSARSILDGDLIVGFSLFLLVPMLGVLLVVYYLWFRRQKATKPSI